MFTFRKSRKGTETGQRGRGEKDMGGKADVKGGIIAMLKRKEKV